MSKILQTVKDAADGLGITHEYVLKNYKDIFENAKNDRIKLLANEKMGDVIGTHGEIEKTSTVGAFLQSFTPRQIEDAEKPQLKSGEDES